MSDHITVNVEKFIEITNSIKALHKKVKEFRSAQKIVEQELIRIMKEIPLIFIVVKNVFIILIVNIP